MPLWQATSVQNFRQFTIRDIYKANLISFGTMHDKTNKKNSVPSYDADQSGGTASIIRVLTVYMKEVLGLDYHNLKNVQRRL